jgi:tetratricopeptide (TPR) repeat protein
VEIVRYEQVEQAGRSVPKTATEPPLPADVETSDELFVIGTHLDQYRHATRTPQSYWHEAAHRDPGDSRANHSLGLWHIKRGEFVEAERCFRCSIARLTERNANPRDGEPFYSLGLALRHEGRMEEAYDAFYKATWNYGWRSAAHLALSEIGASRGDFATALDHVRLCLRTNADHTIARNLGVMLLRKLGREHEAEEWLSETLALDPLDYWAIFLAGRPLGDNQALLDVAFDLIRAGFFADAKMLLEGARLHALDGSVPMVHYTLGYIAARSGDAMAAAAHYRAATEAWPDYCFPSRLDELIVLEAALQTNAEDHRAHCYIGNWLYNHGRHEEAIEHWNLSAALHPAYSVVWRNLGIALFNIRDDVKGARAAFDNAAQANAADARVLYERDQLWKKTGQSVALRIAELERRIDLVAQRDDLTIELATLYNQSGQPHRAADLLAARRFQPWEGGEGLVLGQYVRTRLALGRRTLADGSAAVAIDLFLQALNPPENLGEAWHLLANRSQIYYWLGMACDAAGRNSEAHDCFTRAADSMGDFQEMSVRPYSEMTYYTVLALKRLNRLAEAMKLSRELLRYARILRNKEPRVDYFATSLPAMLLFKDDLQKRNQVTSLLLEAQAASVFGYRRHSRRLLRQLLQLDPNHNSASDFADELAINTPVAETTEP